MYIRCDHTINKIHLDIIYILSEDRSGKYIGCGGVCVNMCPYCNLYETDLSEKLIIQPISNISEKYR